MNKKKLQSSKPLRFQDYSPKLEIPQRFLDMINDVQLTADGQLMPEQPWLEELKASLQEHPENQLILDAIGDLGKNLSQGEQSKVDMFLKVLRKGEENMGVGEYSGKKRKKIENRLTKNGFSPVGSSDDLSNWEQEEENDDILLSPRKKPRMIQNKNLDSKFVGFEQNVKKNEHPFGTKFKKGTFLPQTEVYSEKMKHFSKNNGF